VSVTLKLSDADAKLIGAYLGGVGVALKEVRDAAPNFEGARPEDRAAIEADFENRRKRAIGAQVQIIRTSYGAPDELIRLGHAFDTAAFANEAKR